MKTDICFIVEGSYPFVTGGVSSWLHRYIKYFENKYTFSILSLTAGKKEKKDFKYQLPSNVKEFVSYDIFDFDSFQIKKQLPKRVRKEIYPSFLNTALFMKENGKLGTDGNLVLDLFLHKYRERLLQDLFTSEEGFSFITQLYERTYSKYGFLKYFYNFKNIIYLLARTLLAYNQIPEARIYHSPSTGLSGLLAILKTYFENAPSLVTEHGIYVQERVIELMSSKWLDEFYLRLMWIDFFKILTKWQYDNVSALTTLSNFNVQLQLEYGAEQEKIVVIPNGINVERFIPARRKRLTDKVVRLGLVARVDPIKDVKTYVNTVSILKNYIPNLEAYIIGPIETEKKRYYQEVKELIKLLGVEKEIIFTGSVDVVPYYKKIDILLLTSIKEAMPLVVMEAMASGVPVVSTRVGSCSEMLEDDELGSAGFVVPVMDAYELAGKVIYLVNNPEIANRMGEVGIKIIDKRYREEDVMAKYDNLYQKYLS